MNAFTKELNDDESAEPLQSEQTVKGRDTSNLRIFKSISQRSEIFRTPSDKKKFTTIANACQDYALVLDRIAEWGDTSNSGIIADPKRYVIGSMMAIELEESHRLHLASAAAAYSSKKSKKDSTKSSKLSESQIAFQLFGGLPSLLVPRDMWYGKIGQLLTKSIPAHNIMNYQTDLKYVYVLCYQFNAVLKDARLPSIRFHDLRHTAATVMLRNAIPAKIVSTILGHSSTNVTLDTYSHVAVDMQEGAAKAMDKMLHRLC